MRPVLEQLRLPVVTKVVRQEQGATGQGLEDAHVEVIADAAVKHCAGGGVGVRHLLEIAAADKHRRVVLPEQAEQVGPGPGQDVADEANVVDFLDRVLGMASGSHPSGSQTAVATPSRRRPSAPSRWAANTRS